MLSDWCLWFCRVVLEGAGYGPPHLRNLLCGSHYPLHCPRVLCLQEDEDITQAQVCVRCDGGYMSCWSTLLCPSLSRISLKRDSAVSKEVLSELSQSSGKKLSKAEKDER